MICIRLVELMLCAAVPSAIITFLNVRGILKSNAFVAIALLICAIMFFAYNIYAQRSYYMSVFGDKLTYCFTLIPYVVFALLTLLIYTFQYNLYVWLFSITKFLRYAIPNCDDMKSIILFHAFGIIMIVFSPVGLAKRVEEFKSMMDYDIREKLEMDEEDK